MRALCLYVHLQMVKRAAAISPSKRKLWQQFWLDMSLLEQKCQTFIYFSFIKVNVKVSIWVLGKISFPSYTYTISPSYVSFSRWGLCSWSETKAKCCLRMSSSGINRTWKSWRAHTSSYTHTHTHNSLLCKCVLPVYIFNMHNAVFPALEAAYVHVRS